MREALTHALGAGAARVLLDAILATTRFVTHGEEHLRRFRDAGRPVIFILWHGRLLPLTYYHRRQGIAAMISRSGDGEYIARIVEQWGYKTVRGSSSRGGGSALRQLVRHGRAGRSLAITPDGPRGPRQQLKPGALLAAQLTGAPLIPTAAAAARAWWFGTWDRFLVPKPFATIQVAYGPPIFVPRDAKAATLERVRDETEAALNALLEHIETVNGR